MSVPCTNALNHGFYSFSPTLFADYFRCVGFQQFRFYLQTVSLELTRPGVLYRLRESHFTAHFALPTMMMVEMVFLARKPLPYTEDLHCDGQRLIQSVYADRVWKEKTVGQCKRSAVRTRVKRYMPETLYHWLLARRDARKSVDYIGTF